MRRKTKSMTGWAPSPFRCLARLVYRCVGATDRLEPISQERTFPLYSRGFIVAPSPTPISLSARHTSPPLPSPDPALVCTPCCPVQVATHGVRRHADYTGHMHRRGGGGTRGLFVFIFDSWTGRHPPNSKPETLSPTP